jgi:hypothetical protein
MERKLRRFEYVSMDYLYRDTGTMNHLMKISKEEVSGPDLERFGSISILTGEHLYDQYHTKKSNMRQIYDGLVSIFIMNLKRL